MKGIAIWTISAVGSLAALVIIITVPIVRSISSDTAAISRKVDVILAKQDSEEKRVDTIEERQSYVLERLGGIEAQTRKK